jgi:hypothetical protein
MGSGVATGDYIPDIEPLFSMQIYEDDRRSPALRHSTLMGSSHCILSMAFACLKSGRLYGESSTSPHVHCTVGSSDLAFFRNSICFMCFWFGLEKILRIVYKKVFLELLNSFYLIWPFILRKKQRRPLKELKNFFFEIGRAGYQKKRNFALISKMCRSLEFGKREKKIFPEKLNF